MPTRATKRGAERTALDRDCDVLICGASFAGLAVARELRGTGAEVLVLDRYEIGERQTSACGIPTGWLDGTRPRGRLTADLPGRWSSTPLTGPFTSTCHGRFRPSITAPCARCLPSRADSNSRPRRSTATPDRRVHTDRGDVRAPLIIDALGWRRVLGKGEPIQPPDAYLSRGLEVHPLGSGDALEVWVDRSYVPAGYGWSFPAAGRSGLAWGRLTRAITSRSRRCGSPRTLVAMRSATRAIGSLTASAPAAEQGVFFVGDSAGHCLPLDRRGDQDRALLRHRLRPRAARGRRGLPGARERSAALRRLQREPQMEVRGASASAAADPDDRAASARSLASRHGA